MLGKFFRNVGDKMRNFGNANIKIGKNSTVDNLTINGMKYTSSSGVIIKNNLVYIDGVVQDGISTENGIDISIVGNVDSIDVQACNEISVEGNVSSVTTNSGDVKIGGDVSGNVRATHGDVSCSNVSGDVGSTQGSIDCGDVGRNASTTHGDIKCGNVSGNVNTVMGDVKIIK